MQYSDWLWYDRIIDQTLEILYHLGAIVSSIVTWSNNWSNSFDFVSILVQYSDRSWYNWMISQTLCNFCTSPIDRTLCIFYHFDALIWLIVIRWKCRSNYLYFVSSRCYRSWTLWILYYLFKCNSSIDRDTIE